MQNVLTCAQMRAADKYTIETLGVPSAELMERAGAAIAEEAEKLLREIGGRRVLAVCGGGNNGGDGWCAARFLAERGFETAVYTLTDKLSPDCAAQRAAYEDALSAAGEDPAVFTVFPEEKFDVVLDAVFGTGFRGAPEGKFAEAIARMNESGAKIVSADIPSGLNGDTGAFVLCVKADVTVTIGELKGGLLLGDGADVCGKIVRKDIGISLPSPAQAGLCGAADFKNVFPPRRSNTHKGSFGRAVILAGSAAYSGAPFLSAGAALKCGCGYTRLAVPADIFPYCVGKLPEAILTCTPAEEGCLRYDEEFLRGLAAGANAVAVGMGCGVSKGLYDSLAFLLSEYRGTLVIDADALTALAEYGADILREKSCRVILTPHAKEFSRLCGKPLEEVLQNGGALARAFAAEYGVTVLLKGHTSLVTNGKFTIFCNEGTPALAKGGSGDVLSGVIVSLAARGVNAMDSAACGSWLMGRAGRLAAAEQGNEYSVCGTDVIAKLPAAISQLIAESGKGNG